MTQYRPALSLSFLTPFYDIVSDLMGFGKYFHAQIADQLKIKGSPKVLDIGTGTGNLAIAIKKKFPQAQITAIDPDPKILNIAKEKIAREGLDINFVRVAVQKLPFKNETFDLVVSSLAVHHFPKNQKKLAFHEMERVAKPKGLIYIADFGKPKNIFTSLLISVLSFFEDVEFCKKGLITGCLKEFGLKNVREVRNWLGVVYLYKGRKD